MAKSTQKTRNPAKIIRFRFDEEVIHKLSESRWWDYSPEYLSKYDLKDVPDFVERFQGQLENEFTPRALSVDENGDLSGI